MPNSRVANIGQSALIGCLLAGALAFAWHYSRVSFAEGTEPTNLSVVDPDRLLVDAKDVFQANDPIQFSLGVTTQAATAKPLPTKPIPTPTPAPPIVSAWHAIQHALAQGIRTVYAAPEELIPVETITATVLNQNGEELTIKPTIVLDADQPKVTLPDPTTNLSPGSYQMYIAVTQGDDTLATSHPFTWATTKQGIDPTLFDVPSGAQEVEARRTENTITFKTGARQFTSVGDPGGIFNKNDQGQYLPFAPYGRLSPQYITFDHLPQNVSIEFDRHKPAYILRQGSNSMTVTYAGAADATVENTNTITYALSATATLRWQVVGNKVVKAITVTAPENVPDLNFSITTSKNLTTSLQDNYLVFTDDADNIIFTTADPFLTDPDHNLLDTTVTLKQVSDHIFAYEYDASDLAYPYILDPSSGPNSPGTVAEDSSNGGSGPWASADAAAASDGSSAQASTSGSGDVTYYLKATNFGFSIDTGATIDGIKLQIEKQGCCGDFGQDVEVKLVKGGTVQGNNKASVDPWNPVAFAITDYGGTTDLWGLTWTPANINASNFGAVISAGNTSTLYAVDHMKITVTYTEAASARRIITVESIKHWGKYLTDHRSRVAGGILASLGVLAALGLPKKKITTSRQKTIVINSP